MGDRVFVPYHTTILIVIFHQVFTAALTQGCKKYWDERSRIMESVGESKWGAEPLDPHASFSGIGSC
jgi:hypothetical protein